MVLRERSGVAVTFTALAGSTLMLAGFFHVIEGIIALVNDEFFVGPLKWVFEFDLTSWGLIHLLAGVVAIPAGIGLIAGAVWARTVAVVVTVLAVIANFLWVPYYPWWSLLFNVFDLFVLWAVIVHRRDAAAPRRDIAAE